MNVLIFTLTNCIFDRYLAPTFIYIISSLLRFFIEIEIKIEVEEEERNK